MRTGRGLLSFGDTPIRNQSQKQHKILTNVLYLQDTGELTNSEQLHQKIPFGKPTLHIRIDTSVLGFEIAAPFKKSISVALLLAFIGAHI